jgi:egghead protein (zeste-white 4 protein)
MQTNRVGDQMPARLKQLGSQHQALPHTSQDTAAIVHGLADQTEPFVAALSMRDIARAWGADVSEQSTLPTEVVSTAVPTELSPLWPPPDVKTEEADVSQYFTRPIEVVGAPVPNEFSPSWPAPGVKTEQLSAGTSFSHDLGASTLAPAPSERLPTWREKAGTFLRVWLYRIWLLCATALLTFLLLWLQALLDHAHLHTSPLRMIVQWAELIWLTPIPLAVILWIGWFLFAQAARPDPAWVSVPVVTRERGLFAFAPPRPVRLVFRFVTRGENVEVLQDSVRAVYQAFARYQHAAGPYRIEIASEQPLAPTFVVDRRIQVYVVPPTYVTRHRSRFKARALAYLQEQVRPGAEDWYIYLDEESLVDEHLLAGVYRFIWQSIQAGQRAGRTGKGPQPAGLIGQGGILYQGGNWFFRGADGLRTADDLGRFRLQYALGFPMFGIHGSYIVVRGIHDTQLSFDVGAANSITEDAAWALRARAAGFRFAWVDGYLHEQPPQTMKDFVRQRSRWLSGIRAVLGDRRIPVRYRLCLGLFTLCWQLAFLPFLVALVALFVRVSPFSWVRAPADFAWATYILAYIQGIDLQSRYPHPFLKKKFFERQLKRALSWALILGSIWYSLLEALGVIYSFKPRHEFFVIQKPSLAAAKKQDKRVGPHQ